MVVKVYGMSGCSTVKRAKDWLDQHAIAHDYAHYGKVDGLADTLDALIDASELTKVLSPISHAFKKLDERTQQELLGDRTAAVQAMVDNPRLAKRPIALVDGKMVLSGFNEAQWREALL